MSGIVGVMSESDCKEELFYSVDYHSHMGTAYGGIAVFDGKKIRKKIHNIARAQFKARFVEDIDYINMRGNYGIGVISDRDTQPLVLRLKFGEYAICGTGYINNQDELAEELIQDGFVFSEMTDGYLNQIELAANLINKGKNIVDGINYMYSRIEGSMSLILLGNEGLYAVRDKYGRTPLVMGRRGKDIIVASETCSFKNHGFTTEKFLGPGEIILVSENDYKQIKKPSDDLRLCAFLFVYTGFPASEYEGKNVEAFRERSGKLIAKNDEIDIDLVAGVADSGTAYAHGYSHESGMPLKIPMLKYTPGWARSYIPPSQERRDLIALMKQVTADELIKGRKILITEDSIVRGTQLKNYLLVKLWEAGAKEIHVRVSCPALMFPCKFLLSTRRAEELLARRVIRTIEGKEDFDISPYLDTENKKYLKMIETIEKDLNVTTLKYQRLEDMLSATELPEESFCTYCWTGREKS